MSAYECVWINAERMQEIRESVSMISFVTHMQICVEFWHSGNAVEPTREAVTKIPCLNKLTDEDWQTIEREVFPLLDLHEGGLVPKADLWCENDPNTTDSDTCSGEQL